MLRILKMGFLILAGFMGILVVTGIATHSKTPSTKTAHAASQGPWCDPKEASQVIGQVRAAGAIYSMSAIADGVAEVYVTESWSALPMDQKRQLHQWLLCWVTDGKGSKGYVYYHNHRTEEKIARGGRNGLRLL